MLRSQILLRVAFHDGFPWKKLELCTPCHKDVGINGKITFRDKTLRFTNWGGVTIQIDGEWFHFADSDKDVVKFKRVTIGTRNAEAELGRELRWWRKKWGMTQEDAADWFQVSQAKIARIEGGSRSLTADMYKRIRFDRRHGFKREKGEPLPPMPPDA